MEVAVPEEVAAHAGDGGDPVDDGGSDSEGSNDGSGGEEGEEDFNTECTMSEDSYAQLR